MDQITQVVSWTDTLKDTAVGEQRRPWGGERIDDGLIDISGTPKAKKAPKADPARAARRKSPSPKTRRIRPSARPSSNAGASSRSTRICAMS